MTSKFCAGCGDEIERRYHLCETCRVSRERSRRKARGKSSMLRSRVFRRDRGICAKCGRDATESGWQADHIVPISEGGPHRDLATLRTLCTTPCHEDETRALRARLPHYTRRRAVAGSLLFALILGGPGCAAVTARAEVEVKETSAYFAANAAPDLSARASVEVRWPAIHVAERK